MTYLVTGATGFLGGHITDMLLSLGERPRVLVRPGESLHGLPAGGVEVRYGDVVDRPAMQAAVAGVERVLHCAARTGPWGQDEDYMRTNVIGLRTLIEASLDAGVQRFVHVSSAIVHGTDVRGVADESSALRVAPNPYSRSKIAGEALVHAMIRDHRAPISIVRPGLVYGPRDVGSFDRFASLIEGGQMVVIGSGRNHIPLVYVTDVARGVLLASESGDAIGRSYLLVNDEPVTQLDYLGAIAAELNAPTPARSIPYRLTVLLGAAAETGARLRLLPSPPPLTRFGIQLMGGENRFSISRAREELGYKPEVMVAEGVRRSVRWYRTRAAVPVASNGHV